MAGANRPRLADGVLVRRHVIDGVPRLLLHEGIHGKVVELSLAAWELVRRADGARDPLAIAEASAGEGAPPLVETLTVFDALERAGLLADGPPDAPLPGDVAAAARRLEALADRAVAPLAGYTFRCTGDGECCDAYLSVALTAGDVERAKLGRGAPLHTPLTGGAREDCLAMALVDGRCQEREADGRCRLHVVGGEQAKPIGCRSYPRTYLDDGEVVRVSVLAQCGCVLRSVGREAAASDSEGLAPGVRVARDLPEGTYVRALDERVALTEHVWVERAEAAAWSRGAREARVIANPVEAVLERALALRDAARRVDPALPSADPAELLADVLARFARAVEEASRTESWRGRRDRMRAFRALVARAARRAVAPGRAADLARACERPREESLHLRAAIYGHLLPGPLVDGLVGLAARLVVAREIASEAAAPEVDPLAVVELVNQVLVGP